MKKLLWTLVIVLSGTSTLFGQSSTPILSGAFQFVGSSNGGVNYYQPLLAPVLVAPLGDHWLIESRGEIQGLISRENGSSGPYQGQFFASLDYAQIDYIASSHLTITAGRFLTPFNIYNERYNASLDSQPARSGNYIPNRDKNFCVKQWWHAARYRGCAAKLGVELYRLFFGAQHGREFAGGPGGRRPGGGFHSFGRRGTGRVLPKISAERRLERGGNLFCLATTQRPVRRTGRICAFSGWPGILDRGCVSLRKRSP